MRLLIASLAALGAVALATPSFAQESTPTTPTPAAKPKPGTTAYCNTLKSTTSRNACLKRVHASAAKSHTTAKKTTKKPAATPKADGSAQAAPMPAPSTAAAPQSPPQTIAVPPLPAKTI